MTLAWLGIALAGLLNGSFAVPMKTAKRWSFHHIWGVFTLLAMAAIPWGWVVAAVPGWHGLLSRMPGSGLASLIALGLAWGVASLLYGIAVDALGVAIGMATQLGLSIVVGAILPRLGSDTTASASNEVWFWLGLAVMVSGVAVCAWAGRSPAGEAPRDAARFRRGLIIALLGGLGAPLLNVGIQRGLGLLAAGGATQDSAKWIVWAVFLTAAAATQAAFCLFEVARRGEFGQFTAPGSAPEWLRATVMGVLWFSSIGVYGVSAGALGPLGTSVGWPVFIGLIVVTSNAWGVAIGEWRNRPASRLMEMSGGSLLLVAATFLIAQAR